MTQQIINVGSAIADGTGEPARTAFTKCNDNFTELYAVKAPFDALAYNGIQINGGMEVAQFGSSVSLPTGPQTKYVVDGWMVTKTGTSVVNVYTILDPLPGYAAAIQIECVTTQPIMGTDYIRFLQLIEGYRITRLAWGTAAAMPITVGFWIRTALSGTYRAIVLNFDGSGSTGWTSFTVSSAMTWVWVVVQFPGMTTGNWKKDNTIGMQLLIEVGSASTPNVVGTVGNTAAITGVVVLPGNDVPSAARAPLIMRPFDQELITCQRYWNRVSGTARVYATGANYLFETPLFYPTMRAAPTVVLSGGGFIANMFAGFPQVQNMTVNSARFALQAAAVGDMYALVVPVNLDARL